MTDLILRAERRTIFGKRLDRVRKEGKLPAILYGRGIDNVPLFLAQEDFVKIFAEAGENTVVKLEIRDPDGAEVDARPSLIHDVKRDPVSGVPIHADFYQIRTDEKVRVSVPLVVVGESPAVKHEGGILVRALQEIEVEAFPQNLPREILVDISALKSFEDKIAVKDLAIPQDVAIELDSEAIVALVQQPRSEEELKALGEKPVEAVEEVKVEAEEKKKEAEAEAELGSAESSSEETG
ncbi:MAG: 50S ribosomal protein L25 [Parcubacteria group bacterium]|nr:50S ribosomal protein L25 [Parcubacteria group bacterium]